MIRKARNLNLDMSATDPTPEEIRQRTEAIRKTWSPREKIRRTSIRRVGWTPPVFSEVELPAYLVSDFDPR